MMWCSHCHTSFCGPARGDHNYILPTLTIIIGDLVVFVGMYSLIMVCIECLMCMNSTRHCIWFALQSHGPEVGILTPGVHAQQEL